MLAVLRLWNIWRKPDVLCASPGAKVRLSFVVAAIEGRGRVFSCLRLFAWIQPGGALFEITWIGRGKNKPASPVNGVRGSR